MRLKSLWNEGAAFGLPIRPGALLAASAATLGLMWSQRKRSPLGVGLILGGGVSNLWERVRHGSVYDYVRFPKAPEPVCRYVFNLADFAIFLGAAEILAGKGKKRR